jgi:hypothetical protein
MKILNWEIKKVVKAESVKPSFDFKIMGTFLEEDFNSYETMHSVQRIIGEKIAEEILPEFKAKLLTTKGVEQIINEIRLNLAKQIIK